MNILSGAFNLADSIYYIVVFALILGFIVGCWVLVSSFWFHGYLRRESSKVLEYLTR